MQKSFMRWNEGYVRHSGGWIGYAFDHCRKHNRLFASAYRNNDSKTGYFNEFIRVCCCRPAAAAIRNFAEKPAEWMRKNRMRLAVFEYAEIIRIQKAIYYLQNSLTYEIYERLGYYDQAHFIKDFKKNTSLTPSRFERANSQYKIV